MHSTRWGIFELVEDFRDILLDRMRSFQRTRVGGIMHSRAYGKFGEK